MADLGCRKGQLPSIYLGMLLGATFKKKEVWNLVNERTQKRPNGWKSRFLSKDGKLTLAKVSLVSIPIQFLSLFVVPVSVCLTLERIQRDFFMEGVRRKRCCILLRGIEFAL